MCNPMLSDLISDKIGKEKSIYVDPRVYDFVHVQLYSQISNERISKLRETSNMVIFPTSPNFYDIKISD